VIASLVISLGVVFGTAFIVANCYILEDEENLWRLQHLFYRRDFFEMRGSIYRLRHDSAYRYYIESGEGISWLKKSDPIRGLTFHESTLIWMEDTDND